MPKVVSTFGAVPDTGCYIVGSKGSVLMQDDYGAKCAIAMNDEAKFVDVFEHEGAKKVERRIPFISGSDVKVEKATVGMKGFAIGHYVEFVNAIRGVGPVYEQTHSRCFCDIEYTIPQMEGILVGCVAQQVSGKLAWNTKTQAFDNAAANALVRPYVRKGFEF